MGRIVKNLDEAISSSSRDTYSIIEDEFEMFKLRNNTHYFSSIEIKDKEELKEIIEFLKKVENDLAV